MTENMSVQPNTREMNAHNVLLDVLEDHSLTNTQLNATREGRNLDLHLTTRPSLIKSQAIVLGLSDHDMVVTDAEV